MALPTMQKKWVIVGQGRGLDEYNFTKGPVPTVGEHAVLGVYMFHLHLPVVGGSDGAGEVIDVGSKVTKWKKGDRVTTIFNPGHQSGQMTRVTLHNGSIGGSYDGTFQQYGVFEESWLVRLASNLSYHEGATLSDCGPSDWVLTRGTGGMGLFAIQFAKARGARVVSTTSSPEKYDLHKNLGVDHIINYNEDQDWGQAARKFTPNGEGFDHVIDVGNTDILSQSVQAIRHEGIITVIRILTGVEAGKASILSALLIICTFRSIHISSKDQIEEMMAAIEANRIQSVMDKKVFNLEELREGLEYLKARKHVGKVIVNII
ncbi:hypothetical protein ACQKWADRAFT_328771 [Trichoderma austrokoningii]